MTNLLLAAANEADRNLLAPYLRKITLHQHQILNEPGDQLSHAYFPLNAVISLVVTLASGETIEAAMVGRDGVIGAAASLDGKISINRAIVQIGGDSLACGLDDLKKVALQSPGILSLLMRHEQTVYAQAQQSAACNIAHNVEARLARWILRARNLSGSDTLPFTQESLAVMLGVSRTTVSLVANTLQQSGMIQYRRGRILITGVEAMRQTACECYETVQTHYHSLLGYKPSAASE